MKKAQAFTLIEVMIILLITSLFMAAMAPLITKLHKLAPKKIPHGVYMCYYKDGVLTETMYNNKIKIHDGVPQGPGGTCLFTPPAKSKYFLIQAVGGGGGGSYAYSPSWPYYFSNFGANRKIVSKDYRIPYDLAFDSVLDPDSGTTVTSFTELASKNLYYWVLGFAISGRGGHGGGFTPYPAPPAYPNGYPGGTGGHGDSCMLGLKAGLGGTLEITGGGAGIDGVDGNYSGSTATAGTSGQIATATFTGDRRICTTEHGGGGGGPASDGSVGTAGTDFGTVPPSSLVICQTPTFTLPVTIADCATTKSQNYFSAHLDYVTKTMPYGQDGASGEFKTIFVPMLKTAIPITLGAGGLKDQGSTGPAGKGGTTNVGASGSILQALGGTGGTQALTADFPINGPLAKVVDGYVYGKDPSGRSSISFSAYTQLSSIGKYTGLSSSAMNYGQGGQGGRSATNCTYGVSSKKFMDNIVESTEDFDPWENNYSTCDTSLDTEWNGITFRNLNDIDPYGSPALDLSSKNGTPGAVVISW